MNKFHGQKSVWPIIKQQIKKTKKSEQIFVAIAYVGVDAAKLLPLRKGDVFVCNASDSAIKQGSTSAKALQTFFNRGVKIFNEPQLHGKVVVFPKRVFVGSANVSTRSRDILYEAVIETTDLKTINSSLGFVQHLALEISQIHREDIVRLRRLKVTPTSPPPPPILPPLMELPRKVSRLLLVPIEFDSHSKSVAKEITKTKKSVRSDFFKGGARADIEAQQWDEDWWSCLKPKTWYVGVSKSGRLYKPMQAIKLTKVTSSKGILWLAKPTKGKASIKEKEFLKKSGFDWEDDKPLVLKEEKTRALLKLFQEK